MTPKKIAFITMGPFSHINESVRRILCDRFPDHQVETIDALSLVKARKDVLRLNKLFTYKEYGAQIWNGRKPYKNCFYRTPYMFKKIKRLVSQRLSQGGYAFSFQTQSLFDASAKNLPHFVYTDHTHLANLHYRDFQKRDLYAGSWIRLERTIYRNAAMNFTMSANISRSLLEQYGCDPGRVVCVNAGPNSHTGNQAEGRGYGGKTILFVGVDWERKGGPELVEAFKMVQKRHADARLLVAGCSPQLEVANCDVVGVIPLEEVSRYYNESAVFCVPTRVEPFGIVFIEALWNRLPVVATNVGALPDFIVNGENGYLVEPGNVGQLAGALNSLLDSEEKRRRFGERGHQIAAGAYAWEQVGLKLEQHIRRVIQAV